MEWNFTYENQEASSFLVYQLEKSEQLDTVGMGMLSNNQIPHILPLLYTQIDEERYLRYAIPDSAGGLSGGNGQQGETAESASGDL